MARPARGTSVSQTIGGVLVGFDEQVWSRRPPAQERVASFDRVRTVVSPDGLTIELPATAEAADVIGAAARGDRAESGNDSDRAVRGPDPDRPDGVPLEA